MRCNPPLPIHVVRKEEKESKLKDFIARDLAMRRARPPADGGSTYLVIARSLDSPVSRALFSLAEATSAAGVDIRLILLLDDAMSADARSAQLTPSCRIDARLANDVRLLDAHELVVLGASTVWIGDCMRRDPAKRDAYEFYSEDAEEASRSAERSFERLWRIASPIGLGRPVPVIPDASLVTADSAAKQAAGTIEAATRH